MPKQMAFDVEARAHLRAGVDKIARAVGSTLGPKGRNAILDKSWGGPSITKDGVTVADEIELEDPYENMAAQLVREAATRTNKDAGRRHDHRHGAGQGADRRGHEAARGRRPRRRAASAACARPVELTVAEIGKRARKINVNDRKQLEQIATISANGDTTIGKTLATRSSRVGADGVITIEEGKSLETTVDVVEGMQFDRGFLSSHFVTNVDKLEACSRSPTSCSTRTRSARPRRSSRCSRRSARAAGRCSIIAEDLEGEALATLGGQQAARHPQRLRGQGAGATATAARPCSRTSRSRRARRSSRRHDMDLEKIDLKVLGTARKVVISAENTTIVQGAGKPRRLGRVKLIRREIEQTTSDYDREKLQERLARLSGGHRRDPRGRGHRDRAQGAQEPLRGRQPRHARRLGRGHPARAAGWRCCERCRP
jgi:chaperonin GroEL